MRLWTYNAGGLKRNTPGGQKKASWLLGALRRETDVVAVGLQETHCSSDDDLCQAMLDLSDQWHLVHAPARQGDGHAGVAMLISKEYSLHLTM